MQLLPRKCGEARGHFRISSLEQAKEKEAGMNQESLVQKALEAHGLKAEDCLSIRVGTGSVTETSPGGGIVTRYRDDKDMVTLVTKGGQKIQWRLGEPPVEIPPHQRPDAVPIPPKKLGEAKRGR